MTSFHDSYAQQKEAYYSTMREAREASPDKQPELIQLLLGELFSHKVALASLLSDSHSAI
jgi:hypothetical protein